MIKYNDLLEMAKPTFKECGLKLNKVNIGVWAKLNGWKRIRKSENGVINYYYKQIL